MQTTKATAFFILYFQFAAGEEAWDVTGAPTKLPPKGARVADMPQPERHNIPYVRISRGPMSIPGGCIRRSPVQADLAGLGKAT